MSARDKLHARLYKGPNENRDDLLDENRDDLLDEYRAEILHEAAEQIRADITGNPIFMSDYEAGQGRAADVIDPEVKA
ncbi:hypothetical protein [Streptomyces sp. NPDC002346]